jgi:hypothetical protein
MIHLQRLPNWGQREKERRSGPLVEGVCVSVQAHSCSRLFHSQLPITMPPVREHDVLYDEEDDGFDMPSLVEPMENDYAALDDDDDDGLPPLVDKPIIAFNPPPPGFFPLAPPTTYEIPDFDAAIKSSPPATPGISFSDEAHAEDSNPTTPVKSLTSSTTVQGRTPQRTRIRKPVARDPSYIPRPPNAFILFRSSFIRDQRVPGNVEGNSTNLSKIIGESFTGFITPGYHVFSLSLLSFCDFISDTRCRRYSGRSTILLVPSSLLTVFYTFLLLFVYVCHPLID